MMRVTRLVTGLALVVACGSDDPSEDQDPTETLPAGVSVARDWYACEGEAVACLDVEVPLDYDRPDGDKIAVSLNRSLANPDDEYHGVLLVNPGGPGLPGRPTIAEASMFRQAGLLRGFDLIGFDPRGTGPEVASCVSETQGIPIYRDEGVEGLVSLFEREGQACEDAMGPLFRHVGSRDVVRDMDAIRQVLGEEQLNYLGLSYGTRLGALYAQTYPERTRAVVLDAPMGPISSLQDLALAQFPALLDSVAGFFEACSAGEAECPDDPESMLERMTADFVERDRGDQVGAIVQLLLSLPTGRDELGGLLLAYELATDDLVDAILDAGAAMMMPTALFAGTNRSVHCTDETNEPLSIEEVATRLEAFDEQSPDLISPALALATCLGWPATRNPVPALTGAGAPPVLIIAGRDDVLTPLPLGEALADSFEGSELLVSDHYGHGITLSGEPCVTGALMTYLTTLTLPEPGATCP